MRHVGAILRGSARTEDVVAQTYLDAWRQLPRLRDPERFSAWVLCVAHNRAVDELCRPSSDPIDDAPEIAAPAPPNRRPFFARQTDIATARAAILALPSDQREVVTLRHLQGLSHSEVARQMGRSEGASRALLHRAMMRVRRKLEKAS